MRTILIVDDDSGFRDMVAAVFAACGFAVLTAASPADALSLAGCHEVDAVLTDYQMPKTNGLELCRSLSRQETLLDRRVPIWVMSGSITLRATDALAAGACGYFPKPFRAVEVAHAIQRHLESGGQANVASAA